MQESVVDYGRSLSDLPVVSSMTCGDRARTYISRRSGGSGVVVYAESGEVESHNNTPPDSTLPVEATDVEST